MSENEIMHRFALDTPQDETAFNCGSEMAALFMLACDGDLQKAKAIIKTRFRKDFQRRITVDSEQFCFYGGLDWGLKAIAEAREE